MSSEGRERQVTEAFVGLADTLVNDFDVADLSQSLIEHCMSLLDAAAAGIVLSDQRGSLQVLASSSEATRLLELFQLQNDEGPCLECFHAGRQVAVPDLDSALQRWPRFVPVARQQGYAAVHALPLRLREEVIGGLNLFSASPGSLSVDDMRMAQALADVATIGILQDREAQHHEMLVEQLQGALNSRVVIEQAKGILAEATESDISETFPLLRAHSRDTNTRLTDLAQALVEGRVSPATLTGRGAARRNP